jgi:hypothetical protein
VDAAAFVPGQVQLLQDHQQQLGSKQGCPASATSSSGSSSSSVAAATQRQLSIAAPAFNPSQLYLGASGVVAAVPAGPAGAAAERAQHVTATPVLQAQARPQFLQAPGPLLRHAASEPTLATSRGSAAAPAHPAAMQASRALAIKAPSSSSSSSKGSSVKLHHAATAPVPAAQQLPQPPPPPPPAAAASRRPLLIKPPPTKQQVSATAAAAPAAYLQVAEQQQQQVAAPAAPPPVPPPPLVAACTTAEAQTSTRPVIKYRCWACTSNCTLTAPSSGRGCANKHIQ